MQAYKYAVSARVFRPTFAPTAALRKILFLLFLFISMRDSSACSVEIVLRADKVPVVGGIYDEPTAFIGSMLHIVEHHLLASCLLSVHTYVGIEYICTRLHSAGLSIWITKNTFLNKAMIFLMLKVV